MPGKLLFCVAQPDRNVPSPRVPAELIDRIVELTLMTSDNDCISAFRTIASFSLASKDFREISLRQYFHDITTTTVENWTNLFSILETLTDKGVGKNTNSAFTWVRAFCASSDIISHKPIRLSSFTNLHRLSIDLAKEGLSTQHPCLRALFSYFDANHLILTSLTLSHLPRIDPLLLRLIAETFPRLSDLYLSCTERVRTDCCWSCFEDSFTCTIHSPIPDDYTDVRDMANAFSTALQPLTDLADLHLGIYLSDELVVYSHFAPLLDDEEKMGLSTGHICVSCLAKSPKTMKMRGLEATMVLAQRLKALRSVGWSWFSHRGTDIEEDDINRDQGEESDESDEDKSLADSEGTNSATDAPNDALIETDDEAKMTFSVLRGNGRIIVRIISGAEK
ncbi:hypothetical protein Hypma_003631 [Hypsizygus marmoreus]|uniref:Uncharacterized protein n=1 Tax=Hypsizygus marmoreus TaxID=39966 RepID=A0A369J5Q8_HYPMA|nr:hypothetical protein Hypma_003631 [Hypsizygus marmoreus]